MRKLSVLLAVCLLLALAACGGNDTAGTDAGSNAAAGTTDTAAANPTVDATRGAPVLNTQPKPEGETDPLDAASTGEASSEEEQPAEQPATVAEAPKPEPKPAPKPDPEPEPEPAEKPAPVEEAPTPAAATAEEASAYIGQDVSSLISALGNPVNRSYAPSCLGEGEDGELNYSGFTVYTYREGDSEKVQAVE